MRKTKKKVKRVAKSEPLRKENRWIEYPLLALLVIGAFLIRTLPSWNKIFVDGHVWFRDTDSWYHMRLVENMAVNFPVPLRLDMFAIYPGGMVVGYYPLLSWFVTIPGKVFGYEVVGAFLPPILGALTLIPVFFIGKTLWNKWVGLFSCLLLLMLPSEFFHKTMLGYMDHHILEVFFSTLTILFLILLHKNSRKLWSILAGVSLGLYMSSWSGGLLLVLPIWIWFFISSVQKLAKGEPIGLLCRHTTTTFLIALLIFLPNIFLIEGAASIAFLLFLVALTPYLLLFLSRVASDWWRFVIIAEGALILFILFGALYHPQIFHTVRSVLPGIGTTIEEAVPSYPNVLFSCYGLSFFLFLGGLFFAIRNKQNLLLVIWASYMLLLVLGQRRWGYYFTISNAIMASYFVYLVGTWVSESTRVVAVAIVCLFVVATSVRGTIGISTLPPNITGDWYAACRWLSKNTPEPCLSDVDAYYKLQTKGGTEYGILSWWDYGDWITQLGHRAPLSNPMVQDPPIQSKVLVAQSEEEANKALEDLNVKYIMVDRAMAEGKFYAIARKSPYLGGWEVLRPNSFTVKLWEEKTETWKKVHQTGEVKIYGRIQE